MEAENTLWSNPDKRLVVRQGKNNAVTGLNGYDILTKAITGK